MVNLANVCCFYTDQLPTYQIIPKHFRLHITETSLSLPEQLLLAKVSLF